MSDDDKQKEISRTMQELRTNLEGYKNVLNCLNGDGVEINAARDAVHRNIRITMEKMEVLTQKLLDLTP